MRQKVNVFSDPSSPPTLLENGLIADDSIEWTRFESKLCTNETVVDSTWKVVKTCQGHA